MNEGILDQSTWGEVRMTKNIRSRVTGKERHRGHHSLKSNRIKIIAQLLHTDVRIVPLR